MTDIKDLLTQWGQWSKTSRDIAGIGYKPLSIYRKAGGHESSYEIDSKMLEIDKAMQWLKEKCEFDYRLLKLKYRYGFSYNRIADKLTKERKDGLKTCDKDVKRFVEMAEWTIEQYLTKNP